MRQWTAGSAGLCLLLAACGESAPLVSAPAATPQPSEKALEILREVRPADLSTSERAALVYARIVTAAALYRAGETGDADVHAAYLDPAQNAALMVGLDTLGYDAAALGAFKSAPQDEAASAQLDAVLAALRPTAAGDVKATTAFLMRSLAEAYEAGIEDGAVVDAASYQSAYGLAVAARDIAGDADPAVYGDLQLELDLLLLMWPGMGPVRERAPAPELEMAAALSRVKGALDALP